MRGESGVTTTDVEVIGGVVCAVVALETVEHRNRPECRSCGYVARCFLHGGLSVSPT